MKCKTLVSTCGKSKENEEILPILDNPPDKYFELIRILMSELKFLQSCAPTSTSKLEKFWATRGSLNTAQSEVELVVSKLTHPQQYYVLMKGHFQVKCITSFRYKLQVY